nr:immunoglobulin heavy chain junction region [Mus musculus]
CARGIHW